jgi:predicted acyltransferase
MNCPKCQTQNEENAQFCRNCGTNLHQVLMSNSDNKSSDILLIVFIIVALILNIAQFSIQKFVTDWYQSPTKYIQGGFWILQNLSFLLIAIAIKNKPLKITGIILTVLLISYWLFTNIQFMLR